MSQPQRKILFPTPVYFKDLPDSKNLNKHLYQIKKGGIKVIIKKIRTIIFLTLKVLTLIKQIFVIVLPISPISAFMF